MIVGLEVELLDGPELRDGLDVGRLPVEGRVVVRGRAGHGLEDEGGEALLARDLGVQGAVTEIRMLAFLLDLQKLI